MTRISFFRLLGWTASGGLVGAGLLVAGLPPVAVALVIAGVGLFAATYQATGVTATSAAAIIALSPGIMTALPIWAAISIATVIYLFILDLALRLK